jgi:hypothetical protein
LIVLVPLHLCQFRGFGESSWLVTINAWYFLWNYLTNFAIKKLSIAVIL